MNLTLRSLLPLLAGVLLASQLQAQVASPSLNLSRPSQASAVVGWKEETSAQASYFEGNGKRRQRGSDIYEFSSTGSGSGLTLPFWMLTLDAQAQNRSYKTKINERQEGTLPIDYTASHVALAISDNPSWYSLGVGSGDQQQNDYQSRFQPKKFSQESSMDGSLSLKLGDWFYLGNGVRMINDHTDERVDLFRSERLAGVGMIFGQPGESRFRMEISRIESPKAFEAKDANLAYQRHDHELTDIQEAEVLIQGLLFSGRSVTKTVDEKIANGSDKTQMTTEIRREGGVIWVPKSGLYLGFAFINEVLEHPSYTDSHSSFQINTGYIF